MKALETRELAKIALQKLAEMEAGHSLRLLLWADGSTGITIGCGYGGEQDGDDPLMVLRREDYEDIDPDDPDDIDIMAEKIEDALKLQKQIKQIKVYQLNFATQSACDEWVKENIGENILTGYDPDLVDPEVDIVIEFRIGNVGYGKVVLPGEEIGEEDEKIIATRANEVYYVDSYDDFVEEENWRRNGKNMQRMS